LALTPQELNQWVLDKINADRLTWSEMNDITYNRGLHHKYDHQLVAIIDQYKTKYVQLVERYKEHLDQIQGMITNFDISQAELKDHLAGLKDKVLRMADKYWACKWELEGRRLDIFKRTPVGTFYYIDLDNGNDSNDGLTTGNAWLTIEKYTTVTVRSAGDKGFLRANTSQTGTQRIEFDESGDKDNYISIIGCDSVVNDPWGDGLDVKPQYDQNSGSYRVNLDQTFWWLERLDVRNSAEQGIYLNAVGAIYLKDCEYRSCAGSGLNVYRTNNVIEDGGLFYNCNQGLNYNGQLQVSDSGFVRCIGTKFDAGASSKPYYQACLSRGYDVEFIDVDFAYNNASASEDVQLYVGGSVRARNCNFSSNPVQFYSYSEQGGGLLSEDHDQTYGAGKLFLKGGTVTKQTSPITDNAIQSYKMEPNSNCGPNQRFMCLCDNFDTEAPFVIEGTASQQITITIKMQAESAWSTYPTADELYIEASYYDSAVDAGRSTVKSTQVISAEDTWTSFTVTCTPLRDGPIYVNVYLKKYEAGKSITVNGEATTS